jgi:hypothetical protein
MPYENVPAENAPAIPARPDEYTFTFDIDGYLPDGSPRSTIDDLDLFSPESKTTNTQMLDYLDRVVTKVACRGEQLFTRVPSEDGEALKAEGVRGKGIPYAALKQLMAGIGEAIKASSDAKN